MTTGRRRRLASSDRASGGARIRGCSPARRATPRTSRCPAWCTRRSCAARTATRASAASTRAAPRARPASSPCSPAQTPRRRSSRIPCAWLLPNADLKVAPYRAMANDVVRYVGDAVAVVVAESEYQAYDALELIDVDYEPLPAVVDPQKAAAAGRAAAARGGAGQRRVPLDRRGRRRRRGVHVGRRRRPRSHHPAAADPDGDGDARRGRAVHAGHRRADALEHDAEPAHRPLHHVARHRRARGSPARRRAGGRRRLRQQDCRRSRATSSRRSAR